MRNVVVFRVLDKVQDTKIKSPCGREEWKAQKKKKPREEEKAARLE